MASELKVALQGIGNLVAERSPAELLIKGYRLWQREGLAGLRRLYRNLSGTDYNKWIQLYDTLSDRDRLLIKQHIQILACQPLISVLMPVFNPTPEFLEKAIESVRKQLYPHWELCIAGDASTDPEVREILARAEEMDQRIHVSYHRKNGHISAASNVALGVACGEFIALLDHDDELSEHALYLVAATLNKHPNTDLLYSDEDKIDREEHRFDHYFKPDWNPDLFLSQNFISHLGVYRRSIAQYIGGFREGYEGSQDWDFALRYTETTRPERIQHLPFVLYHKRAAECSTAISVDAKDCSVSSARLAVQDAWLFRRRAAEVSVDEAGHIIARLPLPSPLPLVSVVICTRNHLELFRKCIEGLTQETDYPAVEVLVVDNGSDDPATLAYLSGLKVRHNFRLLRDDAPFNFARLNNLAAKEAQGQVLCLLNNDIEPIHADWLRQMVAHVLRPEIGAVGAKLLYPDGSVQHGGVFLNGVAAGHIHLGYPRNSSGYGGRARLAQNLSAVTAACLVVRKSVWDEVGGMEEAFAVAFNDVDFCLRVQSHGYRNLWLPQAELYHHESASRGREDTPEKLARFARETAMLQERWMPLIEKDPGWNPNLSLNGAHIGLASPPRRIDPWLSFDA